MANGPRPANLTVTRFDPQDQQLEITGSLRG